MAKEKEETKPYRLGVIPFDLAAPEESNNQDDLVSVLVFEIGGEVFAIGVEQTEGVVDCPRISPLPSPPDGIVGVTSVRGRITLVMDLSLSLSAGQKATKRRLILIKGEAQLGLLADRVEGIEALAPKMIRPAGPRKQAISNQSTKEARVAWPITSFFRSNGRKVPIIAVERLGEA